MPASATDVLGYGPISEELAFGRLGLIWAFATAYACPLPTIDRRSAVLAENEAFAQRDELRLTTPDDFMARRGIFATADIAAESSDQANSSTQCLGGGYSFFLA